MKGWEVYSWQAPDNTWRFSLLIGTNRNKELAEVLDPIQTIVGIPALKWRLSQLAPNEGVVWGGQVYIPHGKFSFPSDAAMKDIQNYARQHNLRFSYPSQAEIKEMEDYVKQHKIE